MTDELKYNGNKLIAEFMGVKLGADNYSWRPGIDFNDALNAMVK